MCFCSQAHQLADWSQLNHKTLCPKYAELKKNERSDELIASWTEDEVSMRKLRDLSGFPERQLTIEPEILDERQLRKDTKFDEASKIECESSRL